MNGLYKWRVSHTLSVTACGWPCGSWQFPSLAEKGRWSGVGPSLTKSQSSVCGMLPTVVISVRVIPNQGLSQGPVESKLPEQCSDPGNLPFICL